VLYPKRVKNVDKRAKEAPLPQPLRPPPQPLPEREGSA